MSKITDALNQIWYEQDGKQVKVGLTRSFLDTLDECWHILPANNRTIKAKAPLMMVETNDSLVSVLSPVSGNVLRWETRATNFPDQLTEDDVIMVLTSEKQAEVVADYGFDPVPATANGRLGTARPRDNIFRAAPTAIAPAPWQVDVLRDLMVTGNHEEAQHLANQWGVITPGIRVTPAGGDAPEPF